MFDSTYCVAVLQHIRTHEFSYTLAPGDYGRDGIDEFWLDRKEGFCEHFAAAFVVVMRAAGVPARIVTGYQGTDLPAVDGYYIVRQSSAHAWAEFWQPGNGWVRADPTGAVAPERIGRSYRLAPQPGFVVGTLDAMNPQLFAELRSAWEAVNNRWNQWVLNYSRGQQLDVLKQIGFVAPTWEDLASSSSARSGLALAGAIWPGSVAIASTLAPARSTKRALEPLGVPAAPHRLRRAPSLRVRERPRRRWLPRGCVDAPRGAPLAAGAPRAAPTRMTRDFNQQARGCGRAT
jgi:hypothetical protein